MKKNVLLLLMSLLCFKEAHSEEQSSLLYFEDAEVQKPDNEDRCCVNISNFYVKGFGGANFLQNTTIDENKTSYHTGYIFAGSLGYCWPCGLRLEAEYAYRRNAIKKIQFVGQGTSNDGHVQTSSYMANLSTWGNAYWNIRPYIGAGIGYDFQQMHAKNSRIDFHQKWNRFAWQLMAGLAYQIFCNTELSLEYKFHQGGPFYNHAIGLGLTYKFGYLK